MGDPPIESGDERPDSETKKKQNTTCQHSVSAYYIPYNGKVGKGFNLACSQTQIPTNF